MVFGYYNDTCSNETHLFFALGRGIESVKKWSPVALGQILLRYTESIFYCWPRHWGVGGIIHCYAAMMSFTLRHAVER
jgi:hypothetical protein